MGIFNTDKQTLSDLNILPRSHRESSIFQLFDRTVTKRGSEALLNLLRSAKNSVPDIEAQQNAFRFFIENDIHYRIDPNSVDFIEYYIAHPSSPPQNNPIDVTANWIYTKIKSDNDHYVISRGIQYLVELLISLDNFVKNLPKNNIPQLIIDLENQLYNLKKNKKINELFLIQKKISFFDVGRLDYLFRKEFSGTTHKIMELVYLIDAHQAVAKANAEFHFCFPNFKENKTPVFNISGVYHPFIKNAVKNSLEMQSDENVVFLTGSNMSGKSTFLKLVGVCVYLAHAGLPVPATQMTLSVLDGLYTTINLPDDIFKGYSHYYSEVKRIKEIAHKLLTHNHILVILDELFRGTNVKDAVDATHTILSYLSKMDKSAFLISTHLTEVGEKLKDNPKITFRCLNSELKGDKIHHTYTLKPGISTERLGLSILKAEGVFELLEKSIPKPRD